MHWIDPKTLVQCNEALTCTRLVVPQIYHMRAKSLFNIYVPFKIQNKVMRRSTDNGRNFLKAFTVSGVDHDNIILSNEANSVEFIDLFDIVFTLNTNMHDEDYNGICLSSYFRCTNHKLDLVLSKDFEIYFDKPQINKTDKYFNQLKKLYRKILSERQKVWNKKKPIILDWQNL